MTDKNKLLKFYNNLIKNPELSRPERLMISNYIERSTKDEITSVIGLSLDHLGLQTLPDSIVELKNLTYLNLANNEFKDFPKVIFELTSLERLSLEYNHITVIPEAICYLTNLKELNINHNKIQILPESICILSKLFCFQASYNELISLPVSFGKNSSSKQSLWDENPQIKIVLDHNKIAYLPSSMKSLPEIGEIHLEYNNLKNIPEWFFEIKCLVFLRGNPGFEEFRKKGWYEPQKLSV